jgi:cytochrome P450
MSANAPDTDPAGIVDFDDLAARRAEGPVNQLSGGGWYVGRQKELIDALKDVGTFRADLSFGGTGISDEELFLSEIPEPRHGQVRRVYNAQFGPHRISSVEPFARALCADLLDRLLDLEQPDLVADYTSRIPSGVIAHVIGVPPADAEQFVEWSNDNLMLARSGDGRGDGDARQEPPIQRYITALMAERREASDPPRDVVTGLLRAEVQGAPLTDVEIRTQIQFIVASAVDTTRKLLANLFSFLLTRPDLFADLRADRSLAGAAIEETMRFLSPVQATPRKVTRPASLGGVDIEVGESLMIGIGSANRDESVYDDPNEFRLDRSAPRNHVGFGAGPHVCPGATLARLESVVALEEFLDRVATIRPVPDFTYDPVPSADLHRPRALPVVLERA